MTTRQAKTSSSTHNDWAFDVFLHFITGKDTPFLYNFIQHLYDALNKKGIRTFIQYDTESGFRDEIHPGLLQTIKDSRMAIIVFSKEFASSTLCLDVLVQIYQCIHGNGRRVWPIFYEVDLFEVKHQRGKYEQALATHEQRADEEKIKTWKRTLREVANLKGSSCDTRSEVEVITKIVNDIFMIINQRDPLNVAKSLFIRMAHKYSKKVVKVWRLMGFGSSITGFICFALGPSFQKLFGRWNLLKIVVYCILSSMFSLFILYANRFRKRFPRGFLLKALVSFLVLLFTSLYSYYDDLAGKKDGETEGKGHRNILSLISFGSFALMSMSLSIQLQPGFEEDMSKFFLGCLVLGVVKKNLLEGLGVGLLCFIVMIIQSYSDFTQEPLIPL